MKCALLLLTVKSALFNFEALLVVLLLAICSCAYLHESLPFGKTVLDRYKKGSHTSAHVRIASLSLRVSLTSIARGPSRGSSRALANAQVPVTLTLAKLSVHKLFIRHANRSVQLCRYHAR